MPRACEAVSDGHGASGAVERRGDPTLGPMGGTRRAGPARRGAGAGLARRRGTAIAAAGVVAGRRLRGDAGARGDGLALAWRSRRARDAALCAGLACAAVCERGPAGCASAWPTPCRRRWKGRTSWSPVSSPSCRGRARSAPASASKSSRRRRLGAPAPVPQRMSLGWYRGWDGDALIAAPFEAIARGPALALHGAVEGSRMARSTRTVSTSSCGCSSKASAPAATCAPAPAARPSGWTSSGAPGRAAAPACARRHLAARADARAAGVLAALAVGDQAAIERDDWDLFRTTGVAHLMSISGLHVTMFAWLAGALVGWVWRRSRAPCWPCPRRWPHAGAACCAPRRMRCWPAGACRRSARCGCWPRRRCCAAWACAGRGRWCCWPPRWW